MSFPICQKANDASCLFLVETGHHPVQLPVLSGLRALRVIPTRFACADTAGWFSHTLLDHAWIRWSSDQVNKVQPLESGSTSSSALRMLFAAATRSLPITPPLEHQETVWSAAFSPDGTRVVTACLDKTARVWDAASGKPLSPPLQHQAEVVSAAFSPDGTRVVTASEDKTARVWDAASGKPLSPPLQHQAEVRSAAFSPDGTRVVTACLDKTAQVWDMPLASGTPAEWRATMDRASPFVLINGVLSLRNATE